MLKVVLPIVLLSCADALRVPLEDKLDLSAWTYLYDVDLHPREKLGLSSAKLKTDATETSLETAEFNGGGKGKGKGQAMIAFKEEHVWGSENHCKLSAALHNLQDPNTKVAILGGSPSAGAGDVGVQKTWFTNLRKRFGNATMLQLAMGQSMSFSTALIMDSLLDDADIMFWEYAINDAYDLGFPNSPEDMKMQLAFFVNRAQKLPSKPAMVFNYLFDARPPNSITNGAYSTALREQKPVIEQMAAAGMDVLILPSGPYLRPAGPSVLADHVHPNAQGHKKISNFVRNELDKVSKTTCDPEKAQLQKVDDKKLDEIWKSITKDPLMLKIWNLRSSSRTFLTPRKEGPSAVAVCAMHAGNEAMHAKIQESMLTHGHCNVAASDTSDTIDPAFPVRNEGKIGKGRIDRKEAMKVPQCNDAGTHGLLIALKGADVCKDVKIAAMSFNVHGNVLAREDTNIPLLFYKPQISVDGGDFKSYDLPHIPYGKIPDMVKFGYNTWLDIDKKSTPQQCRTLKVCARPNEELVFAQGTLFY